MRLLLASIVLLVAAFALPGRVAAQSVAVMRLDAQSVPFSTVGQLSRAVSAGVSLAGFTVEEAAASSTLNDVMLLIGCSTITPECLTELAQSFDAPLLVYGTARQMSGGVELQLTSFDARVPRMLFSVAIPITTGTESQLVEVTASLMSGLGAAWVEVPGDPGALLISDDGSSRALPTWVTDLSNAALTFTVRTTSGRSTSLTLSAPGPTIQLVEAGRGGRVERERTPRDGPASAATIAGWSAIGAGAATGVVAGIFGMRTLSLQDDFDAELRQRQARELADQGLRSARTTNITVAVAATLVAGGVTALVLGRNPERAQAGVPRLVADGAGLGLRF